MFSYDLASVRFGRRPVGGLQEIREEGRRGRIRCTFPQAATSWCLKASSRLRNFFRRAKAEGHIDVTVFELATPGATKPSLVPFSGPKALKIKAVSGVLSASPSKVRPWEAVREIVEDEWRQNAIRATSLRNAGQRVNEAP